MVEGGPPKPGGGGWIAVRPPLDGPSRLRILVGAVAVVVAALSSLALLNLLVLEPVVGEGPGDDGGDSGGSFGGGDQPPGTDPGGGEGDGTGGEPGQKRNPCTTAKSLTGGFAITFTAISLGLWVLSVWWRQSRQTRVMNGWAITALVFTLVAVTLLFAWWLVTKVCNLDVFDLKACRDIARSLLGAFIGFLVPAVGLVAYAVVRKRQGGRFFGLWSGAGFVFLYLAILAMVGWLVADDFCDRRFEPPEDIPDPDDPDGGGGSNDGDGGGGDGGDPGGDPGDPGGGGTGNAGGGGGLGDGGGSRSGGGDGGGGLPTFQAPQVSPVMLLVILGMAAAVVIIVLALRSRQNPHGGIAAGTPEEVAVEDRATLLELLRRTDLRSDDRVVAAYRSYLSWATVRGVGKYPHETPREHGRRVTYELDLPWDKTEPLLDAYTHVRLGDEELDEDLRRKAVAFAEGIRDGAIRPGRPFAAPRQTPKPEGDGEAS